MLRRAVVATATTGALLVGGGVAAPSAAQAASTDCWSMMFSGNYFPNPVNRTTHQGILKARINLLVLTRDSSFNPATVTTTVYSITGAAVRSSSADYDSGPSQDIVVADVLGLGSGNYIVKSEASSPYCGTKAFSQRIIVL